MPVFQDPERRQERPWGGSPPPPLGGPAAVSVFSKATATAPTPDRRTSEESIRTEFCDGPVFEEDPAAGTGAGAGAGGGSDLSTNAVSDAGGGGASSGADDLLVETNDREELIQRIKRGQSTNWRPNRTLDAIFSQRDVAPICDVSPGGTNDSLLPAFEIQQRSKPSSPAVNDDDGFGINRNLSAGFEIQRPRSALHAGDFTEASSEDRVGNSVRASALNAFSGARENPILATSPPAPWSTLNNQSHEPLQQSRDPYTRYETMPIDFSPSAGSSRNRTPSLHSFSSSFVLKAPTSPLVQEAKNDDPDTGLIDFPAITTCRDDRRHTMPPQPPQPPQSLKALPSALAQAARQPASLQRESSFPFRSHASRRSLSTISPYLPASSPPTPNYVRSRQHSYSSDASPLQHASMVGSYEESILRGRMSTTPSIPVNFTAQIGALGFGDCKPKYPAHVTLEFPAVYYSWNSGSGGVSFTNDEPSPYTGQIDLEHKLPPPQRKEKRSRRTDTLQMDEQDAMMGESSNHASARRREKQRYRSSSPAKLPVGGSYRIPQKGQLQILIKNPNKTAVKLFLVPYDLEGMEPGTKTFVRQKCYSSGPIIDNPISSKSETALDTKTFLSDPKNKPTIRYMVHLHICCPSRGRFYLYKNISVVFANRVPDNKEKLHNEIRLPEPRYSPYKPGSEQHSSTLVYEAKRALEKQNRRRSYGYSTSTRTNNAFESLQQSLPCISSGISIPARGNENTTIPPVPSIPFDFITPSRVEAGASPRILHQDTAEPMDLDGAGSFPSAAAAARSPLSDKLARMTAAKFSGSVRSNSSSNSNDSYNKLSKGEAGYGGLFGRPGTPEPGEGLLARRLKGLDVEKTRAAAGKSKEQ